MTPVFELLWREFCSGFRLERQEGFASGKWKREIIGLLLFLLSYCPFGPSVKCIRRQKKRLKPVKFVSMLRILLISDKIGGINEDPTTKKGSQ
jgi:hypothetical protein